MLGPPAERNPSDGAPYEVIDVWCGMSNGTTAISPARSSRACRAIPCATRSIAPPDRWRRPSQSLTANAQVDRQDGVAIPINLGELIQARLVLDSFGVVGGNGPPLVVEARVYSAKHCSAQHRSRGYDGTFPRQVNRRCHESSSRLGPLHEFVGRARS
jgi:hypothetical protein